MTWFGETPETWNKLAIKVVDKLAMIGIIVGVLCLVGWIAHHEYFDYIASGIIKTAKSAEEAKKLIDLIH